MPDPQNCASLSDQGDADDPMTTATAEMFMRQRDEYRRGWMARGREVNEIYDALTEAVREPACGFDPVADLKALGAERDRLRAALEHIIESCEHSSPTIHAYDYIAHSAREALNGGDS